MAGRLIFLLAIVPFVELWLLLKLADSTSWMTTVAVVLSTGTLGIAIVRWQGIKAWKEIQRQIAAGQSPSRSIVSGILILLAGGMLLTPGLLTDAAGFTLLIPFVRNSVAGLLQRYFANSVTTSFRASFTTGSQTFDPSSSASVTSDNSERPQVIVVDPKSPRIED